MGDGAHTRIIPARAGFTAPVKQNPGNGGDHPRSRGVYVFASGSAKKWPGSSPLARGLPADEAPTGARVGIIPARAGFTPQSYSGNQSGWDHPRSRGVYEFCERPSCEVSGSSPLARGLRALPGLRHPMGGIIPARAGFTGPSSTPSSSTRDHPRSRGVYKEDHRVVAVLDGSSPLARGLLHLVGDASRQNRIIPARAGFTSLRALACASASDHPRSRGVYPHRSLRHSSAPGSSPLARGLLAHAAGRVGCVRIIPARAGFTCRPPWGTCWPADHPRSRGVYPGRARYGVGQLGIIPARAGFTAMKRALAAEFADHPRSRGVYSASAHERTLLKGSSPLARGLH